MQNVSRLPRNRINTSFSAEVEDKILWKIVPFIPQWMNPDFLTYSSLLCAGFIAIFYLKSFTSPIYLLLINVLLVLNWIADSTDGKVALYRRISAPRYGYYIDHIFDSISAVFTLSGIALSGLAYTPSYWILALVCLLCFINSFLKTPLFNTFFISIGKVGPTDGRIYLFIVNLIVFFTGNYTNSIFGVYFTLIDISGWLLVAFLVPLLIHDIAKTGYVLKIQDTLYARKTK